MRWEQTHYKQNGLYKIEQSAFSVPRLKYRDTELDVWIRDHARTLPLIHRVDTTKGNHQFRVESQVHLSTIVEDYMKIWDADFIDTLISGDARKSRVGLTDSGDEVLYDIHINGEYFLVKYPMHLEQAYKTGRVPLHIWYRDPINAASPKYDSTPKVDMYMELSVDENWLIPFCRSLEEEKYSSAIVDKLYEDINANFFHLQDIMNVATGRSLFTKGFLQFTKFELYADVEYQNLQFQDPFQAIGTYFRNGQQELITLPLLLLE